jgi:hypothetical protein
MSYKAIINWQVRLGLKYEGILLLVLRTVFQTFVSVLVMVLDQMQFTCQLLRIDLLPIKYEP